MNNTILTTPTMAAAPKTIPGVIGALEPVPLIVVTVSLILPITPAASRTRYSTAIMISQTKNSTTDTTQENFSTVHGLTWRTCSRARRGPLARVRSRRAVGGGGGMPGGGAVGCPPANDGPFGGGGKVLGDAAPNRWPPGEFGGGASTLLCRVMVGSPKSLVEGGGRSTGRPAACAGPIRCRLPSSGGSVFTQPDCPCGNCVMLTPARPVRRRCGRSQRGSHPRAGSSIEHP